MCWKLNGVGNPLHYITDLRNLSSILQIGILCSKEVLKRNLAIVSLGSEKYRSLRRCLTIGDRSLDEFVSLYISARTPLLFAREKDTTFQLVCLEIDRKVVDVCNTYYCEGNPTRNGLIVLAKTAEALQVGNHSSEPRFDDLLWLKQTNEISKEEFEMRKNLLEAEVLVLDRVQPKYFTRIVFKTEMDKRMFELNNPKLVELDFSLVVDVSHFS
jgi:hypothetical protein